MVIYLDELILENFLVNLFLLSITFKGVKKKCSFTKQIISAFLGSLYVVVMVLPQLKPLNNKVTSVIVALVMIYICYGRGDKKSYIKATITYIFYSMVLAGITFYISINSKNYFSINRNTFTFNYKKLMLAIIIFYLICERLITYIKSRKNLFDYVYNLNIKIGEENIDVKGFLDTGNELREPITNLPVIVIERELLKNINIDSYTKYTISYSVVNGGCGKLLGFKPDDIVIKDENENILKESILAICDNKLSKENDYNALLPRGILI